MNGPALLAAASLLMADAAALALTPETPAAIPAASGCSARLAVWASPIYRAGPDSDFAPPTGTSVWSCRIGARLLVVRDRVAWPGTYRCSATVSDQTSAWVNGVKVVDHREAGDIEDCYAVDGGPRDRLILVQLDRRGGLMLCYERVGGYDKRAVRCETTPAEKLRRRKRDPKYRAPGAVTPAGFTLHIAAAPFCARLTAELRLGGWFGDTDASLARFQVPAAKSWGGAPVPSEGAEPTAVFDIDNDGVADRVVLRPLVKVHGLAMGELRWGPEATPIEKLFVAAEPLASAKTPPDQPSPDWMAFAWQPVRIEGQTYVYVRRHGAFDWDTGDEDFLAGDPWGEKAITRSLVELKPDGRQALICAWGPRPQPQLYL